MYMSEGTDAGVKDVFRLRNRWYCGELKTYEINLPCRIDARHHDVIIIMTQKLKSVKARNQKIDAVFLNTPSLGLIL